MPPMGINKEEGTEGKGDNSTIDLDEKYLKIL